MRARWAGVLVVAGLAGCELGGGGEKPPPAPLPTDGPNQVVFYVPGMT